jgi:hypothetical protein
MAVYVQLDKGEVVLVLFVFNWAPRHKEVLGSGGTAPRILDLGSSWKWVVSFAPRPLYLQGKSPRYPLDRRLGGPRSHSGRGGEEKNSKPPPGNRTLEHLGVEKMLNVIIWIRLFRFGSTFVLTVWNNKGCWTDSKPMKQMMGEYPLKSWTRVTRRATCKTHS